MVRQCGIGSQIYKYVNESEYSAESDPWINVDLIYYKVCS